MRVVEAFSEPFDLHGTEVVVTASVGLAFGTGADDAASLLRDADVAMYRAKEAGGSRYELFDTQMRTWVKQRFDTEAALRHAVERDELAVHFQPQLCLRDGRVLGLEALARWQHPELGDVSPERFIPLAEETGLITAIGSHVLRMSCLQAAQWNHLAAPTDPLGVGVNVSARQLTQPGLVETVARVLATTGLAADCLTLEITESVLVQDPNVAGERLQALRDIGVRLAIDDFGTGYSSLAYLQRFPLDVIKIDQVFIADVGEPGPAATIVRSVIELAHALGFEVVAEGVEDDKQLQALTDLDCDVIQGYVLAPPLHPDDALRWLRHARRVVEPSLSRGARARATAS
jgi:predicted signal transduction protein with EAL and GGDEF domain